MGDLEFKEGPDPQSSLIIQDLMKRVTDLESRVLLLEKRKVATSGPKKKSVESFPQPVIEMAKKLKAIWPRYRGDDSRPIENDVIVACDNIVAIMEKNDVLLEDLYESCKEWLESKPAFPNAIQFYFGKKEDARWLTELRGYLTRKQINGI